MLNGWRRNPETLEATYYRAGRAVLTIQGVAWAFGGSRRYRDAVAASLSIPVPHDYEAIPVLTEEEQALL